MITTLCRLCDRILSRRLAQGDSTVRTIGACCAHKVGLPSSAAHPVHLRRRGDRRAA